jgi:hypothetical protein
MTFKRRRSFSQTTVFEKARRLGCLHMAKWGGYPRGLRGLWLIVGLGCHDSERAHLFFRWKIQVRRSFIVQTPHQAGYRLLGCRSTIWVTTVVRVINSLLARANG